MAPAQHHGHPATTAGRGVRWARWATAAAAVLVLWGLWSMPSRYQLGTTQHKLGCPRSEEWWQPFHKILAAEVAAADAAEQGWDILFMGDSITETLRGTRGGGQECNRCLGAPEVFQRHMGKHRAHALGIAGDQTHHLLWRISHGELPRVNKPKLVVLLIGTNDLGAASSGGETAILGAVEPMVGRVERIVRYLHQQLPEVRVLLLGLLPRGTPKPPDRYAVPSPCPEAAAHGHGAASAGSGVRRLELLESGAEEAEPAQEKSGQAEPSQGAPDEDGAQYRQPGIFAAAVARANEQLRLLAEHTPQLYYVGCGGPLLLDSEGNIDRQLMADALHPSAAGLDRLFSQCWGAAIEGVLRAAGTAPGGRS